MSMTTRVLLGLVLGAIIGLALAFWAPATAPLAAGFVQPIGRLWLNALQMTVVPLVAALIVLGVNTASDAASSGRTARRAIAVFLVLLTLAAIYTAFAAPALLSLLPRDDALVASFRSALTPVSAQAAPGGFGDAIAAIIPANAIAAAAQSAMLPLVVFSLFFGFALTRIDPDRKARMLEFVQTVADVMIVIVRWVLWVAPLGVFALILSVCARSGLGMLSALGVYVLVECLLYLSVTVMMLPVALFFGGERLRRFVPALVPAQVVAISTQSSLASLPAMLESADRRLGYPKQVAALVLPMAVSLFRLTSPVQYVTSAVFIAWAYGVDLSTAQLLAGALLAVVISLGSVGLPGQVTFVATNLPVAQAMGLPLSPLGLMLAVDTIPDALATLGNVTGDLAATSVVNRQSRQVGNGEAKP